MLNAPAFTHALADDILGFLVPRLLTPWRDDVRHAERAARHAATAGCFVGA